jgi:hypothetical protein
MRRLPAFLLSVPLLAAGLVLSPTAGAAPGPGTNGVGPTVWVGELTPAQIALVRQAGADQEVLRLSRGRTKGRSSVEVILSAGTVSKLAAQGVRLTEKQVAGQSAGALLRAQAASGFTVFRSYSEPGGIRDELVATARANPRIAKLVRIGSSVNGQPILAVKVTKNAREVPDGRRPAVLYMGNQHAREWITPEMNRRLLHHVIDHYATDRAIRKLVDTTELWFLPVANPDGYDFTFTPGNRLWRKNLRDNDGDGVITPGDGVDPNRNFSTKWGYDNEGSSPSPASETYRGPSPASEPETRALDGLLRRIRFTFMINYHSAAELLLYGVGWQVATPTPDDLLHVTMAGDDARPAVPGYDPDISAELYTTNGETDEHAHTVYDTIAFTPEMSTCQTASASDPDDAFDPADCASVFSFPDSEALVQAEFEKNIPFAIATGQSAADPANPVSVVGRTAPNFEVDAFTTSYGSPQTVAVTARRDLRRLALNWSVNGGRTRTAPVAEWKGGERYGGEGDTYYAEYRGVVRGTRPGDRVKVWFTGQPRRGRAVSSEAFSYTQARAPKADVLVLADEDYEGVNPTYPAGTSAPKYAQQYVDALAAKGIRAAVWDISAQGVPHDLGVLDHFKGVVWYYGDNRLTQDPEDELTETIFGNLPDSAVAEREQFTTMAVRDFLNEGGKLVVTGETAGYTGFLDAALGGVIGGIYYGLDGAPAQDCVVSADPFSDCLILSNDFYQYYLGAFSRPVASGPVGFNGSGVLAGTSATFGGQATVDNPLDEPGNFIPTSVSLPPTDFPQFTSAVAGSYTAGAGAAPAFAPFEGDWYAAAPHVDDGYQRLTRTVDLTGATSASLDFALSFDTEPGFDNVIVEAHTVGADDWTTLPDANGGTDTGVPDLCEEGFLLDEHPFLEHYLTRADATTPTCSPTGSTGSWNRFTGSSGGWQQVRLDLSAYAGSQVELSISYVTDPGSGGIGAFVDDTRLTVDGAVTAEGFETGLGAWTTPGSPEGSPGNISDFRRSQVLVGSAISTPDTVLLGFGVEQVADPAERAGLLAAAVRGLLTP